MIRLLLLLALSLRITAKQHEVELWQNADFTGTKFNAGGDLEECVNLTQDLWGNVRAIDTRGEPYHVFSLENCLGEGAYIHPGVDGHQTLQEVGMENRIRSLRLINVTETTADDDHDRTRRDLKPGPERDFWDLFFSRYNRGAFLAEFRRRAAVEAFIAWDFIPGIRGSKAGQYEAAVNWAMGIIRARNFDRNTIASLHRLATRVLQRRNSSNEHFRPRPGQAPPRGYERHLQIARFWSNMVQVLNAAN